MECVWPKKGEGVHLIKSANVGLECGFMLLVLCVVHAESQACEYQSVHLDTVIIKDTLPD